MSEQQKVGLFLACYEIDSPKLQDPTLKLNLIVNTPAETVHGVGTITQRKITPPLDIGTKLDGSFTPITVMPDITHILVTASGYPIIHWPPHGGIGPVLLPNFELRMVLDSDWKSGTAKYKYIDREGHWNSVERGIVKLIKCPTVE